VEKRTKTDVERDASVRTGAYVYLLAFDHERIPERVVHARDLVLEEGRAARLAVGHLQPADRCQPPTGAGRSARGTDQLSVSWMRAP
jgi:hypothetical protein